MNCTNHMIYSLKIYTEILRNEKNKAFDLLDAITKSGALPLKCAEFHLLIATAHSFPQSIMCALARDNIDIVTSMNRTVMIAAATVLGVPVSELLTERARAEMQSELADLLTALG